MAIQRKSIEKISNLLSRKLRIPSYQRPYRWPERLVLQLIQDLIMYNDKKAYRLGTIILYQKKEDISSEIVDGQQRLITLSLLLYHLNGENAKVPEILNESCHHKTTETFVRKNSSLIEGRLRLLKKEEQLSLKQFLLEKCEVVTVTLDDISEAFQFFDSQNARGKELEAYDLLKAFHLREIKGEQDADIENLVSRWEKEIESKRLKEVMDKYLFRIRRWLRGKQGRNFSKFNIDIFKGVTLGKIPAYPHLHTYKINEYFTNAYNNNPVRAVNHKKLKYPFQIDMLMLNGKRFFEYVHYYIKLKMILFEKPNKDLMEYIDLLNDYPGKKRTGDRYIRNLFECVVLYYYDRFGNHGLNKAAELAFFWSYNKRLTQYAIKLATMDNRALEAEGLLYVIKNAVLPGDVINTVLPPLTQDKVVSTKTEKIAMEMRKRGYLKDE